MRSLLLSMATLFILAATGVTTAATESADFEDFTELSLEDLLNTEVVTAAKRSQKISEAPAAMYVITEGDIRQSGALNIPDVLRMVPGLDVMEISATDFVVNARGFNQEMSNKMLVLIDGRSVYWDIYGLVVWDSFPVSLKEIKRIEIVKGPVSALYGANAFSGVINILTKPPEELQRETTLATSYGHPNSTENSLIHGGLVHGLAYKSSLGWKRINRWDHPDRKEGEIWRGHLAVQRRFSPVSQMTLSGGYTQRNGMNMGPQRRVIGRSDWYYMKLDCDYPNLNTKLSWNRIIIDMFDEASSSPLLFDMDAYEVEVQYLLNMGLSNSLILGTTYKLNEGDGNAIKKRYEQSLYAAYAQHEYRPGDHLAITVGARYDGHSVLKDRITPRGNILITPFANHFVRFSYGTAFRSPSFAECYGYKEFDISPQISLDLPSNTVVLIATGNPQLDPEKITSYQAGYEVLLSERIKGKLDLFYDQLQDFITYQTVSYQDVSYVLGLPAGSVVVPAELTFKNKGMAGAKGFEVDFDLLVASWARGWANYSYQDVTYEADDPLTPEDEKGEPIEDSPVHKVNAGLRCEPLRRVSASLTMHHVDQTAKHKDSAFGKVDPYTLFDLALNYSLLRGRIESSLSIFNLFDNRHFEYPGYDREGDPGVGHQVGRRITFGVSIDL